jgi:hypothetical protein
MVSGTIFGQSDISLSGTAMARWRSDSIQRMSNKYDFPPYAWATGTLIIVLVAGLWPFRAPKNDVQWLDGENGLRFGDHGCILSSGTLPTDSSNDSSGTVEMWLETAQTKGRRTILAIEGSGDAELHSYSSKTETS